MAKQFRTNGFGKRSLPGVFAVSLMLGPSAHRVLAQESLPVTALGAPANTEAVILDRWLLYSVSEATAGEDLNGDGSQNDNVLHIRELSTGRITNVGIATIPTHSAAPSFGRTYGDWLVLRADESEQGEDLNADGDDDDAVLHVHHLPSATTTNTRLAADSYVPSAVQMWGNRVALLVSENAQGFQALNGDADSFDDVLHIFDLSSGTSTNVGMASSRILYADGGSVVFTVNEDEQGQNVNGNGDLNESLICV
jgi:hypothetical protein